MGASLLAETSTVYEIPGDKQAYIVPATGLIAIDGEKIPARDGVAIREERSVRIDAIEDAEVVLVVTGKRSEE